MRQLNPVEGTLALLETNNEVPENNWAYQPRHVYAYHPPEEGMRFQGAGEDGGIVTTRVQNVKKMEDEYIFTTRNSVYSLKIID